MLLKKASVINLCEFGERRKICRWLLLTPADIKQ